MKQFIVLLVASVFLFTLSTKQASAALVTVSNDGSIQWNVLPANDDSTQWQTPQPDSLKVTSVAKPLNASEQAAIALTNTSGKIELTVNDGKENKVADLTEYKEEIIEIEQREAPNKISISASGSGFVLKERNIAAFTSFPIEIDPEEKRISVKTVNGEQYLSVLPSEALLQLVQGNMIDIIDGDYLILDSSAIGEAQYTVHGKKSLDILNIFQYEVPVTAQVSAVSGKVISIEQPLWLPIANFLFT